jgi:hypothetical protein
LLAGGRDKTVWCGVEYLRWRFRPTERVLDWFSKSQGLVQSLGIDRKEPGTRRICEDLIETI